MQLAPSRLILLAVIGLLVGDIVGLARLSQRGDSPENVAAGWVGAALAGDCDRLFALSTPDSEEFFEAIGGCPLDGRVPGRIVGTWTREERSDAAVVIVDVEAGDNQPLELLLVRERRGDPWRVEMRAGTSCRSLVGEAPEPGDCEPLRLPHP